MERAEGAEAEVARLERRALDRWPTELDDGQRPPATTALARPRRRGGQGRRAPRADIVAGVGDDLVALYEKIRAPERVASARQPCASVVAAAASSSSTTSR